MWSCCIKSSSKHRKVWSGDNIVILHIVLYTINKWDCIIHFRYYDATTVIFVFNYLWLMCWEWKFIIKITKIIFIWYCLRHLFHYSTTDSPISVDTGYLSVQFLSIMYFLTLYFMMGIRLHTNNFAVCIYETCSRAVKRSTMFIYSITESSLKHLKTFKLFHLFSYAFYAWLYTVFYTITNVSLFLSHQQLKLENFVIKESPDFIRTILSQILFISSDSIEWTPLFINATLGFVFGAHS